MTHPVTLGRFVLTFIFLVALGWSFPATSHAQCDGTEVNIDGNTISCEAVEYDTPVAGQSTWFYKVTSGSGPALSHITFQLETCAEFEDAGTWGPTTADRSTGGGGPTFADPDPTTGVTGMKFDEGFSDGEMKRYYITVDANYAVSNIALATKSGGSIGHGFVAGPDADCDLCDGRVNGNVFHDLNGNSVRDGGEPGLDGHAVGLFVGPSADLSTTTAGGGDYAFTGLISGDYSVDVNEGSLSSQSPPLFAVDGHGPKPADGVGCVLVNFPYREGTGAAIGDFVWLDDDGIQQGVQEAGERGIAFVKVTITAGPVGVGNTDLTDNWGWYLFDNLVAGDYTVEVDPSTADSDNISGIAPGIITKDIIPLSKTQAPGDLGITTPPTVDGTVGDNELNRTFDFAFATNPLPVELVSFEALVEGQDVILTWTTATETNNAGFAVEHRQFDGEFAERAFIAGAGTSDEAVNYSHRVVGLEPGSHGFRLKQIDFDGTVSYSEVVEASAEIPGAFYLSEAYPNPFNPSAIVTVAVRETSNVRVTLHDALGREVKVLVDGQLEAGASQQIRIDGSGLSSGLYLVRLTGPNFVTSKSVALAK